MYTFKQGGRNHLLSILNVYIYIKMFTFMQERVSIPILRYLI